MRTHYEQRKGPINYVTRSVLHVTKEWSKGVIIFVSENQPVDIISALQTLFFFIWLSDGLSLILGKMSQTQRS